MTNRITKRLRGACAVVLLGMVLAGCDNSATATTSAEETTSTVDEPTDTTTTVEPQETTTTTRAPEPTTTTEPQLEVPEEAREVLEAQADEVVLDFLDRVNRAGPGRGYEFLEPADPFDGVVRDTLEVTEALHEWMVYCYEIDWCQEGQQWDPANQDLDGRIEPLIRAGEGEIFAFADGTFYVEGLYAAKLGKVARYLYYTGFKFTVDDGQAVLVDAVGRSGFLKEGVSSWLSALDASSSEFAATPVTEDVSVEVVDVVLRSGSPLSASFPLAMVELTNASDSTVWPYVEGSTITGDHAGLYNSAIPESIENNTGTAAGWNLGFGRKIEPGESSLVFVGVHVMNEQKGSGTFSLPVYNLLTGTSQETADVLFTLDVTFQSLDVCEVLLFGDDFLRDDECLKPPMLDHTWTG